MAGITPVEHRSSCEIAGPGARIAQVAPGIVAQLLFHSSRAVGDGGPTAEVVFQNVMDRVHVVLRHHHGIHARRAAEISEPSRSGCVARGFGDILTVADVTLGADVGADVLFHEDALVVVAVGVVQGFAALHNLAHLVETGVGDVLRPGGEQIGHALRRGNRVDLRGIENWLREDGRHLSDTVHCRHGLL